MPLYCSNLWHSFLCCQKSRTQKPAAAGITRCWGMTRLSVLSMCKYRSEPTRSVVRYSSFKSSNKLSITSAWFYCLWGFFKYVFNNSLPASSHIWQKMQLVSCILSPRVRGRPQLLHRSSWMPSVAPGECRFGSQKQAQGSVLHFQRQSAIPCRHPGADQKLMSVIQALLSLPVIPTH